MKYLATPRPAILIDMPFARVPRITVRLVDVQAILEDRGEALVKNYPVSEHESGTIVPQALLSTSKARALGIISARIDEFFKAAQESRAPITALAVKTDSGAA